MRISKNRIDLDDKVLQKPVFKDYAETVVGGASGTEVSGGSTQYYLDFDGSGDYVSMGDPVGGELDFGSSQDFSVSFWFKTTADATSGGYPGFMSKEDSAVNTTRVGWSILLDTADPNKLKCETFVSNTQSTVSSAITVNDGQWHHAVVVRDTSAAKLLLYLDGTTPEETTSIDTGSLANTIPFALGVRQPTTQTANTFLECSLDDVRIYNAALSAGNVATLYSGDSYITNIVGFWDLDDGSGDATDSSGNSNDGTVTGATWVEGGPVALTTTDYTIDCTQGNVHNIVLASNAEFTFANPPTSGISGNLTLILHQDATGNRIAVWPAAVTWLSGSEPTLSTGANTVDVFVFSTIDGGATWYGAVAGQGYTPPAVPDAPTSLSASPGDTEIDLAWTTPASDGGSAITGYKIYRDTSTSPTTLIDTIGVTTSYNDASVSNGTTYYYRVKAVNATGDSNYSNEDSATPNVLTIVYLTSGTSWSVPADWNSSGNTIEVIGGGGSGGVYRVNATRYGTGGGGGGYAKATNVSLTPSGTATYQIGAGGSSASRSSNGGTNGNAGGDTYFNGASLATSSVGAEGGDGGNQGTGGSVLGGNGGSASNAVGGVGGGVSDPGAPYAYTGGGGGDALSPGSVGLATGGGGAAGLNGAGNDGGNLSGGGVSDGGSGDAGSGGAGGTGSGGAGDDGAEWEATYGSGGGGSGDRPEGTTANGGDGGSYGGGGGGAVGYSATITSGAGEQGLIVITYTPT